MSIQSFHASRTQVRFIREIGLQIIRKDAAELNDLLTALDPFQKRVYVPAGEVSPELESLARLSEAYRSDGPIADAFRARWGND
jgi:hypothetical protein